MKHMTFKDLAIGDTFEVDQACPDEWFRRGTFMKIGLHDNKAKERVNSKDRSDYAVCLTQGVSDQGQLAHWGGDIPVVLVKERVLPAVRKSLKTSSTTT